MRGRRTVSSLRKKTKDETKKLKTKQKKIKLLNKPKGACCIQAF